MAPAAQLTETIDYEALAVTCAVCGAWSVGRVRAWLTMREARRRALYVDLRAPISLRFSFLGLLDGG